MECIWPVLSLWIVFVEVICLQHWLLALLRHALLLPVLLYFLCVIFLLCERCVCPMRSLRFLLQWKANIAFSVKEDTIILLVCRRCQCLLITSLMFSEASVECCAKACTIVFFFLFSCK